MHGDAAAWGTTDYLIADLIDAVQENSYLHCDPKKSKRPAPIPRPGAKRPESVKRFGGKAGLDISGERVIKKG
jgi:hypothetical protein